MSKKYNKTEINSINQIYAALNSEQYSKTARLCKKYLKLYPHQSNVLMLLGVAYKNMGRLDEAIQTTLKALELNHNDLNCYSNLAYFYNIKRDYQNTKHYAVKALQLNPNHFEALINLGNAFLNTDQISEAEKIYNQALIINSEAPEIYNNLGLLFQKKGDLTKSELKFRQALKLSPRYYAAMINLGTNLELQNNLDEALKIYNKAMLLSPKSNESYFNIANIFVDQGKFQEAIVVYEKLSKMQSESAEVYRRLGDIYFWLDKNEEAQNWYRKTISCDPLRCGLRASIWLSITYYLEGQITEAYECLKNAENIFKSDLQDHNIPRIYWSYIFKLIKWHNNNMCIYMREVSCKNSIYVVGESHALSAHKIVVPYNGSLMQCFSKWIEGCKVWHLICNNYNKYKAKFENIIHSLPPYSVILLTIGEIDCRPNEGIFPKWLKTNNTTLEEFILKISSQYVHYVKQIAALRNHKVIFCGIPAPNLIGDSYTIDFKSKFISFVYKYNLFLKNQVLSVGSDFLDIYQLTSTQNGLANSALYIDQNHILPSVYVEAFKQHLVSQVSANNLSLDKIQKTNKIVKDMSLLFNQKKYVEVEHIAQKNINENPISNGIYFKFLGASLKQQNRNAEAINALKMALIMMPFDQEAHNALGTIFFESGYLKEAEQCYLSALKIDPSAEVFNNYGILLNNQARYVEAEKQFRQSILINPSYALAHYNLGCSLRDQGFNSKALCFYKIASKIEPNEPKYKLGVIIATLPVFPDSVKMIESAMNEFDNKLDELIQWAFNDPKRLELISKTFGIYQLYFMAYRDGNHKDRLAKYGSLFVNDLHIIPPKKTFDETKKIKLAIVSRCFCRHSVWYILIKELLIGINKSKFEIALYYTGRQHDSETDLAKFNSDLWRDRNIVESTDKWIYYLQKDNPDIIYYPEIGMDPISFFLASKRLAIIQIAGWGHPMTTGLSTIDIYVSGELVEPPNANDHYNEQLICLSGTGSCTPKVLDIQPIIPKQILNELEKYDGIRLISPHRVFKYDPKYDDIYAKIALKNIKCFFIFFRDPKYPWATDSFMKRIFNSFKTNGLNPEKYILILPWLPIEHFLGVMEIADIYLDCPSFSGYTTAWEAVLLGVPIITLEGRFLRQRLVSGLLRSLGILDTISKDIEHYVDLVVELSKNSQDIDKWVRRKEKIKQSICSINNDKIISEFELLLRLEVNKKNRERINSTDIERKSKLDFLFNMAKNDAKIGSFSSLLSLFDIMINEVNNDIINIGILLSNYGFVSKAAQCFWKIFKEGNDGIILANIANLAREAGNHQNSLDIYSILSMRFPDNYLIRRNELMSLQYAPQVPSSKRLEKALNWGNWIIQNVGAKKRPPLKPLLNRPLNVGYVSSDFCQHTVGLLVKDILAAHDPQSVKPFAYSSGTIKDGIREYIQNKCFFRDISMLEDKDVVAQIKNDKIDILIDLSGHTAGSRLTIFAYRPAPVQLSWLGYFSTTGLPTIDGVLLDEWHVPKESGIEKEFIEPIIRLPHGRLCYNPVPFAPKQIYPPPCIKNKFITFGCFNNSAKLNSNVFDLWSEIVSTVPGSRIILKWRTFHDEVICQSVKDHFARRGISHDRVELRGFSFHADMLNEYGDIDIALDPFPFSGGLTSCEALWMGVPVVTLPQNRVVSRQTFAILSAIDLSEFAAKNEDDYVKIAVDLSKDVVKLRNLRIGMREKMSKSPLMDVVGFTRSLEKTLLDLYAKKLSESESN